MAQQRKQSGVVAQTWKSIPGWGQFLIIAGVGTGAFFGGRKIYRAQQVKKKLKLYQATQVPTYTAVTGANGVQGYQQSSVNLATVAGEIYNAFYNYYGGAFEDEDSATESILKVPKPYINELEKTYNKLFSKDLRNDFIKYVQDDTDNWQKVSPLFN